jgi:hypothetical protein
MPAEKRYDRIQHRFKREAELPIFFTDLTEEQKVLIEMIYSEEGNKEKVKLISETVTLIQNDLDFVIYELNKIQ